MFRTLHDRPCTSPATRFALHKSVLPTAGLLALCLASAAAQSQTITYTPTTPQVAPDVVPAGVGAIRVIVTGGAGGAGSYDGVPGGRGAAGTQVEAIVRVQPGQTITAIAAGGGQGGATYARDADLTGGPGGSGQGAGGDGAARNVGFISAGAGGGGGASFLNVGGAWVRAGGGGGGGGDSFRAPQVADASAVALFTAEAVACAVPASGEPGLRGTVDGGGGGGGGGGYLGAVGTGGNFGQDGGPSAEPGGMGGSCTLSAGSNTISNPTASVPGAPTAPVGITDPATNGIDGLVSFEYIFQPTVTIACDPSALTDSAGQQAVCTVTASTAAPSGGLSVPFSISAADPQYSTQNCSSPVVIPEGATQAPACTIIANDNQVAGEAAVTVSLQISDSDDYLTGTPAEASVVISDNDSNTGTPVATPQAVPSLSGWASLLLTGVLACLAWMRRKTIMGR
ncbi:hypothetical protein EDF71_102130 [Comamonas sp. JUb58]|nr:hypothetical protein EDF71_102130 [Comamonas sp. JUb58]